MMDNQKIISIYKAKDPIDAEIIVSLLDSAGITCQIKNKAAQTLFGAGGLGTGINMAAGAIEIAVLESDRDKATSIINEERQQETDLPETETRSMPDTPPESQSEPAHEQKPKSRYNSGVKSIIWSLIWLFGLGSVFAIKFGIKGLRKEKNKITAMIGLIMGILGIFWTFWFFSHVIFLQ